MNNDGFRDVIDQIATKRKDEVRHLLQKAGFVHITGLPYRDLALEGDSGLPGLPVEGLVQPSRNEVGRWGQNNGKTVAVTTEGEVWLSAALACDVPGLGTICPRGIGAFVPMSNTDILNPHCLLYRVRDPDWSGASGEFSPVPTFRD